MFSLRLVSEKPSYKMRGLDKWDWAEIDRHQFQCGRGPDRAEIDGEKFISDLEFMAKIRADLGLNLKEICVGNLAFWLGIS